MAERRSLGDAMGMTPAKLAFIKGDTDAQSLSSTKQKAAKNESAQKTIEVSRPQTGANVEKEPRRRAPRRESTGTQRERPEPNDVLDQVLVPVTIRLPHRIAQALKHAYLEQRLKYAKPDTQQEIAEEALTDWLRKSDYLD